MIILQNENKHVYGYSGKPLISLRSIDDDMHFRLVVVVVVVV